MAITHKTAATGGDSAGLIGQTQWNEEHTGIAGDGGFAFKYTFDTGTANDPLTGEVRMNNATPSSVTMLYINETDGAGVVIDPILDLLNPTDFVMLSNIDKSKYFVFSIPLPFTSGAGVDSLPVVYLMGTGANFIDGEMIYLSVIHADLDDAYSQLFQIPRAQYFMWG